MNRIMTKPILFIDRDGTLIVEPPDKQIDSLEKLEFIPGMFQGLGAIARSERFDLVMVSNQDGLGTTSFPEETFHPAHDKLMQAIMNEGIVFSAVHIDRSFEHENLPTRKPGTGMLTAYLNGGCDLPGSYVIGDRATDVLLARHLGCRAIVIRSDSSPAEFDAELRPIIALETTQWADVARFLAFPERRATVQRTTKETDIRVELNLDGSGGSDIRTGLGFFNHMLDQLARHGGLDLNIEVKGDLHIDEHHTIEDTALALGEAFAQALTDKRGLSRYGFCLPMDDCLAQVAIDFGGRPWLVWDADFRREKIGEMPTEMFLHFFKSFSDQSRCNLNIKAEGSNEHHKIEAIFKAFARAVRMAVRREGTQLPTTKGVL